MKFYYFVVKDYLCNNKTALKKLLSQKKPSFKIFQLSNLAGTGQPTSLLPQTSLQALSALSLPNSSPSLQTLSVLTQAYNPSDYTMSQYSRKS